MRRLSKPNKTIGLHEVRIQTRSMKNFGVQMNETQTKSINECCEIYHRVEFDRRTDTAVVVLLLSLLGLTPIGKIPHALHDSINSFRIIGDQERYNYTMTAISTLMEYPSENLDLRDLFDRLITRVKPVTDCVGYAVLQDGMFSFGRYNCTRLSPLIFSETLKR